MVKYTYTYTHYILHTIYLPYIIYIYLLYTCHIYINTLWWLLERAAPGDGEVDQAELPGAAGDQAAGQGDRSPPRDLVLFRVVFLSSPEEVMLKSGYNDSIW